MAIGGILHFLQHPALLQGLCSLCSIWGRAMSSTSYVSITWLNKQASTSRSTDRSGCRIMSCGASIGTCCVQA
ncbi:hypothetical protein BU25DRAFT_108295 [Macroventuria anomochaeta]|uniref:Uncharacterized protein n=1 Tax=Macroventuria anomochaeta TaxID=301207 RepID=A0ACB6RUH1_9PLEO|nr:uncharacterized protein BU25DRAFT_108295 [Macroventuria anomochaeta]KAF2625655.1 hypothetical protein BU25DRAFT_108295 [Macroventuria anomochaeta]